MEPFKLISETQEAELKVMVMNMYKQGGALNVLECISTIGKVQLIIAKKLNEILEEENGFKITEDDNGY